MDWLKASPFEGLHEPAASRSDVDAVESRGRRAPGEPGRRPVSSGGLPAPLARDGSLNPALPTSSPATASRPTSPMQSARNSRASSVVSAGEMSHGPAPSGAIDRPTGNGPDGSAAPVFSLRQLLGDRLASVLAPADDTPPRAGAPLAPAVVAPLTSPPLASAHPAPRSEGGGVPITVTSRDANSESPSRGNEVSSALAGIARRLDAAAGGRSTPSSAAPDAFTGRNRSADPTGIEGGGERGVPQPTSGTQPTRMASGVSGRAAMPDLRVAPTSTPLDASEVPATPEPDWVIAVVSDALVEQARRQGVDLS